MWRQAARTLGQRLADAAARVGSGQVETLAAFTHMANGFRGSTEGCLGWLAGGQHFTGRRSALQVRTLSA